MSMSRITWLALLAVVTVLSTPAAAQQQRPPNIVVIMGDDIGMWNIRGLSPRYDAGARARHR